MSFLGIEMQGRAMGERRMKMKVIQLDKKKEKEMSRLRFDLELFPSAF